MNEYRVQFLMTVLNPNRKLNPLTRWKFNRALDRVWRRWELNVLEWKLGGNMKPMPRNWKVFR